MQRLDVLNGNMAAALGAALAKPDVIAAYPITPQTPVVEYLTQFAADKKIDAAMSEVESELSAMSVVTGASLAGSRTFTATASQGLSLMYEPYFRASTLRLPIVMAIVNREMISPQSVWGGRAGQAAHDSGQPEDQADRGRHAAAQAGRGDPGSGGAGFQDRGR